MTSVVPRSQTPDLVYPSSDGQPLAETSVHVDAIINAVVALRQYLTGQPAIVLADQFLYYAQGYPRLRNEWYEPITDGRSEPLKLRLEVEDQLIGFYREDTGEKLLAPDDLLQALQQEIAARQEAEALVEQERQRAEQERQRAEQERQRAEMAESQADLLRAQLRALGIDPDA